MNQPTPSHRITVTLPPLVHEAELETIRERRAAAGAGAASQSESSAGPGPLPEIPGGQPTSGRGLVGLAISGGGIRSSTFSLGVIQALARRNLFRWFDYVSTVSGGGYTGSMLSSLLREGDDREDVIVKQDGQEESAALQHLRNGSNYLRPGGLDDTVRLPAVVIRGLMLNALQLLPLLMLLVFLTEWLHENRYRMLGMFGRVPELLRPLLEAIPGQLEFFMIVVLVPLAFYLMLVQASKGKWENRDRHEKNLGRVLLLGALVLIGLPLLWATRWAIQRPYQELEAFVLDNFTFHVWGIALASCLGAVALVKASKTLSNVVSVTLLYGAAIVGPGLLFGAYLFLVVAQVDSPFVEGTYPELAAPRLEEPGTASAPVPASLALSMPLRHALVDKGIEYPYTRALAGDSIADVAALWCPRVGASTGAGAGEGAWHLAAREADPAATIDPGICDLANEEVDGQTGGDGAFRFVRHPDAYEVWGARLHLWGPPGPNAMMSDSLFLVLALSLLVFNYLFLNVNMSSLHGFYRDRLSRLYLFRLGPSGEIEPNDEQKLSDLNGPDSRAPYHIVNATLNLQGDVVESARGRSSDFFFFSKHYCGGPHTGYCATSAIEELDPRLDLGTAMAISAAAAAPNMGSTTKKSLIFILTLLNFRLGYWLPNPRSVNRHKTTQIIPWRYRPGVLRLFNEALGSLHASRPMVNVSDGGHLENLAIYELLRRRCPLIVAIDGEADPELRFHGLVTLLRLAKIDLGITITIDLERLRWTEDGVTQEHFAIGRIDYGAGETGSLIYVKSSVTGDESPYVLQYREVHPTFPHETTADQFFNETQFEAYRALGEHVGARVADALAEGIRAAPGIGGAS